MKQKKRAFSGTAQEKDILLFTRHLSTMIKAGVTIIDALETLEDQTDSKSFRNIIASVKHDIENGQPLSKSMKKFPHVFDRFYVSLIEVSENSGSLDENLDFIAKQLLKRYRLKRKIQSAMLYPSFVLLAVIVMGGFVSLFVLPQLVDFFEAFNTDLPVTTQILLFVAGVFKNYGLWIWSAILVLFVLMKFLVKTKLIKPLWHQFLLSIPFLGLFLRESELAQMCRNLGILLKSGVPLVSALDVTKQTVTNVIFENHIAKLSKAAETGKTLAASMENTSTFLFPPIVSKMISVGEKTGKLDESLLYLGDFYEEEIDTTTKSLSTVLEPVLLITVGLAVGFLALAIITPIYELTGSIQK